jgi:hypothetical protein
MRAVRLGSFGFMDSLFAEVHEFGANMIEPPLGRAGSIVKDGMSAGPRNAGRKLLVGPSRRFSNSSADAQWLWAGVQQVTA